jgi:hypothetical protein
MADVLPAILRRFMKRHRKSWRAEGVEGGTGQYRQRIGNASVRAGEKKRTCGAF